MFIYSWKAKVFQGFLQVANNRFYAITIRPNRYFSRICQGARSESEWLWCSCWSHLVEPLGRIGSLINGKLCFCMWHWTSPILAMASNLLGHQNILIFLISGELSVSFPNKSLLRIREVQRVLFIRDLLFFLRPAKIANGGALDDGHHTSWFLLSFCFTSAHKTPRFSSFFPSLRVLVLSARSSVYSFTVEP